MVTFAVVHLQAIATVAALAKKYGAEITVVGMSYLLFLNCEIYRPHVEKLALETFLYTWYKILSRIKLYILCSN